MAENCHAEAKALLPLLVEFQEVLNECGDPYQNADQFWLHVECIFTLRCMLIASLRKFEGCIVRHEKDVDCPGIRARGCYNNVLP